jgi:hypothetical protein
VENTLAYHNTATIIAVKSFIVQTPAQTSPYKIQNSGSKNVLNNFNFFQLPNIRMLAIMNNHSTVGNYFFKFIFYFGCDITFSRILLGKLLFSRMTFSRMAFSRVLFSRTTFRTITISRMT